MSNETVNTVTTDPLQAVADALDTAVQVAKGGVEDARATASDALATLGSFLSQLSYKTCYVISFGIVFPAFLLVRAIPKENAAVHGLVDGAHAAMDVVDGMKAK